MTRRVSVSGTAYSLPSTLTILIARQAPRCLQRPLLRRSAGGAGHSLDAV